QPDFQRCPSLRCCQQLRQAVQLTHQQQGQVGPQQVRQQFQTHQRIPAICNLQPMRQAVQLAHQQQQGQVGPQQVRCCQQLRQAVQSQAAAAGQVGPQQVGHMYR
uniref:Chitin-binding protein 2 (Fragments) n=1 Tax=Moringa oleifera TaxID=3735 RepID=CBP2_MOROL|nr:RecName: Full=Chitin-binding protein 2; Short=Mo-CBP2 [Moringa oleifera]